jgi:hypothetical protein
VPTEPGNRDETDKTLSLGDAHTLLGVLSVLADVFALVLKRNLIMLTTLTVLTTRPVMVVAPHRCSNIPSLTVRDDWLSTVVYAVMAAVFNTICFQVQWKPWFGPDSGVSRSLRRNPGCRVRRREGSQWFGRQRSI